MFERFSTYLIDIKVKNNQRRRVWLIVERKHSQCHLTLPYSGWIISQLALNFVLKHNFTRLFSFKKDIDG
ncbi:hypothetical protein MKW92_005676 [Papaver armeniacum]|nr:hypothetical protein MKW92_005676 [Papaver armeniacum]